MNKIKAAKLSTLRQVSVAQEHGSYIVTIGAGDGKAYAEKYQLRCSAESIARDLRRMKDPARNVEYLGYQLIEIKE